MSDTAAGEGAPVVCSMCGTVAASPPMDWMVEADPRRGSVWVCAACVRRNVRSIEARLDQQWW